MSKMKDLRNKKFGKLIVLEPTDKRKIRSVVWKCKCDCGKETFVSSRHLTSGLTKSCGCLHFKDLKNKKFGKLIVLEPTDKRTPNGFVLWKCLCSCGKETLVRSDNLTSGKTKSCGCLFTKLVKYRCSKTYIEKNLLKLFEGTSISKISSKTIPSNNNSGVKGVCWNRREKKWKAYIGFKGKIIDLGHFKNKSDAIKARKLAEEKYFEPMIKKYGS